MECAFCLIFIAPTTIFSSASTSMFLGNIVTLSDSGFYLITFDLFFGPFKLSIRVPECCQICSHCAVTKKGSGSAVPTSWQHRPSPHRSSGEFGRRQFILLLRFVILLPRRRLPGREAGTAGAPSQSHNPSARRASEHSGRVGRQWTICPLCWNWIGAIVVAVLIPIRCRPGPVSQPHPREPSVTGDLAGARPSFRDGDASSGDRAAVARADGDG